MFCVSSIYSNWIFNCEERKQLSLSKHDMKTSRRLPGMLKVCFTPYVVHLCPLREREKKRSKRNGDDQDAEIENTI